MILVKLLYFKSDSRAILTLEQPIHTFRKYQNFDI